MPDTSLEKKIYKTYLKMIENSEGTRMFNTFYAKKRDTNRDFDILGDGEFSCALFVSSILTVFGLLDRPCLTVATLEEKLKESNFDLVEDKPEPGDVIVWEKVVFEDGSSNEHVGFFLDENRAVSTNHKEKKVIIHDPIFKNFEENRKSRKIVAVYRSEKLRSM